MGSYDPAYVDERPIPGQKIILHPLCHPNLSPWFDLRVFYVRVSNCLIDETTPDHLTLNHIPLNPDTILEMNGRRSSIYSKCVSSSLRRNRADKRSEEATFVCTDIISMTGSVRFEVYGRDCLLLTGVLDLCNSNDHETKKHSKKWSMTCKSAMSVRMSFLKNKQIMAAETDLPMVEVYVAGCFSGSPIILTKTLQLGILKKNRRRVTLDSIPEDGATEPKKDITPGDGLWLSEYRAYKAEADLDCDYDDMYRRAKYMEVEDGELSWFNAGVSIGVGIGLGICLGIGLGVGLLVRTYQSTTLNSKKRLI